MPPTLEQIKAAHDLDGFPDGVFDIPSTIQGMSPYSTNVLDVDGTPLGNNWELGVFRPGWDNPANDGNTQIGYMQWVADGMFGGNTLYGDDITTPSVIEAGVWAGHPTMSNADSLTLLLRNTVTGELFRADHNPVTYSLSGSPDIGTITRGEALVPEPMTLGYVVLGLGVLLLGTRAKAAIGNSADSLCRLANGAYASAIVGLHRLSEGASSLYNKLESLLGRQTQVEYVKQVDK